MNILKNKFLLIAILVIILVTIGVFLWQSATVNAPGINKNIPAGLANPASVYCKEQGGELEIRDMDKGQVGICVFDDGECEEWAYFRGECEK